MWRKWVGILHGSLTGCLVVVVALFSLSLPKLVRSSLSKESIVKWNKQLTQVLRYATPSLLALLLSNTSQIQSLWLGIVGLT